MTQKEQIDIFNFKIKNGKKFLKELVDRKNQAKKDFEEYTPGECPLKTNEFKSALSNVANQYTKLSAFIEIGCALGLISNIEFAELVDEISELAFS